MKTTKGNFTINLGGHLMPLSTPVVMGILNATPDSFYAGSRKQTGQEIAARANQIISEGGQIVDIGAFSTRPGAARVSGAEEMERMRRALHIVRQQQPDVPLSIDTFRPEVARMAVEEYGATIINDVSEGNSQGAFGGTSAADTLCNGVEAGGAGEARIPAMFREVARLGVAYILMSVRPTVNEMMQAWGREVAQLRSLGAKDIILDPGFGFGKTLGQNYDIMHRLDRLHELELPLLVGVSRKSMIYRLLGTTPQQALNGTTVLHTLALMQGAHILRAHDVREAVEAVRLLNYDG